MADETDAEKIARLEQECEELVEENHTLKHRMKAAARGIDEATEILERLKSRG